MTTKTSWEPNIKLMSSTILPDFPPSEKKRWAALFFSVLSSRQNGSNIITLFTDYLLQRVNLSSGDVAVKQAIGLIQQNCNCADLDQLESSKVQITLIAEELESSQATLSAYAVRTVEAIAAAKIHSSIGGDEDTCYKSIRLALINFARAFNCPVEKVLNQLVDLAKREQK